MKNGRALVLAPAPREVPPSVWAGLLFGGFLPFFGWLFLGFGMVFALAFEVPQTLSSWFLFLSPPQIAKGGVTGNRKTNSPENRRRVYETSFSFTAEDGKKYLGRSYATGTWSRTGEEVAIEYPSGQPGKARIQGMRAATFGPVVAVVLLFPTIGLAFVVGGLLVGIKGGRLLTQGKLAFGTLKSKTTTGARVNGRIVYKLTFEFTSEDGRTCEVVTKTSIPEVLEDGAKEPLLYDPLNPSYAVMLDSLPGSPQIDMRGEIQAAGNLRLLKAIAMLAIALSAVGCYLYLQR